jgi:hypothetical protein
MTRMLLGKLALVLSTSCLFGFGIPTHEAIANRVLEEVEDEMSGAQPTLRFHDLLVPVEDTLAFEAILAHPEYFRMGATGPDAFPDLASGQLFHHTNRGVLDLDAKGGFPFDLAPGFLEGLGLLPEPYPVGPASARTPFEARTPETYRSIDYATRMLLQGRAPGYRPDARVLAFTMGYLSHSVGDAFMHSYVNDRSKGYWTFTGGAGAYGMMTEEVKHFAVEEFLDQVLPSSLKNSDPNVNSSDLLSGRAPVAFLDDFYKQGEMWNHVGGPLYDWFQIQDRVLGGLKLTLDPLQLLDPLERQYRDLIAEALNVLTGHLLPLDERIAIADYIMSLLPQQDMDGLAGILQTAAAQTEDIQRMVVAYRLNLPLLSECIVRNIAQASATVQVVDNCETAETLSRISLNGVQDEFFREEIEDAFKGIGLPGDGDEDRTRAFNVRRLANYVVSSFQLGKVSSNVILPIAFGDLATLIRAILEQNRDAINEQVFLVAPNLENAMTAWDGAVCVGECFFNDCPRRIGDCISDAVNACHDMCTIKLLEDPDVSVNLCAIADCGALLPNFALASACYAFAEATHWPYFNSASICNAINFAGQCADGIQECAECTEDCIHTAKEKLELVDVAGGLINVMEDLAEVTEPIRETAQTYIVEPAACLLVLRVAKEEFLNYRKFAALQDFITSGRQPSVQPDFFGVNLAFLREDMENPQYRAMVESAAAGSQLAQQGLSQVRGGGGLELFLDPFEDGFPGDCFSFSYEELDVNGAAAAMQDIAMLHSTPGPTAQELMQDFGSDPSRQFVPMENAIAGTKLLPIRSREDVVAMADVAGVTDILLPWESSQYSAACDNFGDGTINLLCDVVNSNDDPDCFNCGVQCSTNATCNLDQVSTAPECSNCSIRNPQPGNQTRQDLELDLELDLKDLPTDTGIYWRRSLSACATRDEQTVVGKPNFRTPFPLASTDEAFEGLYTKIFKCSDMVPKFASFDDPDEIGGWTLSPNGTATFDGTRSSQGAGSMRVCGGNFITMKSPTFDTTEWAQLSTTLAVDVFVPLETPNPWWWGALQLQVDVPAANIYSAWGGQVELTNTVTRGTWNTLTFTLPTNVLAAFEGDFPNARLQLNLNVPPGTECWGFDDLRFEGDRHPRTTFHRTGSRHLDVRTNPFLSFETLADWTSGAPVTHDLARHEHGNASLSLTGSGYKVVTSRVFSTTEILAVGNDLNLDLFVPDPQPNPYWVGQAQVFLTCLSAGLNNAYLGQRELTHLFYGEFNSLLFTLPSNVRSALLGAYHDCRFNLVLNVNAGSGQFLFDKLGFVGGIIQK